MLLGERCCLCRPDGNGKCQRTGEEEYEDGERAGRGDGFVFHFGIDGRYDLERLLVMRIHRFMTGIRRIACEFAGVQQSRERIGLVLRNTAGQQGLCDVVFVQVGLVHVQLVGNEAQEGLVEFLVEGRVEILRQEFPGLFEPGAGHLGGAAVLLAHHVCPAGGIPADGEIGPGGSGGQQEEEGPEPAGAQEEMAFLHQTGLAGGDKADVGTQVLHPLAEAGGRSGRDGLDRLATLSAGDGQLQRLRLQGLVRARTRIVITIGYGAQGKVAVAARDEGIFKGFAALRTAGGHILRHLGVVHLEIGRESNHGRLQQGHVAASGHRHQQRGRIVGLERILAQAGAEGEIPHAAAETGRRSAGKARHPHLVRRGRDAFAEGLVVVLEEDIQRVGGTQFAADIHQADHFGRFDDERACLLRDNYVTADEGRVVNLVVHALAVELDVGGRLHFLAPEAVEGGQFHILEAGDIHPLIQFQRSGDRLAQHHIRLA